MDVFDDACIDRLAAIGAVASRAQIENASRKAYARRRRIYAREVRAPNDNKLHG